MIQFRCSFCNKLYARADDRRGERFRCGCGQRLKVPRRSGGNARVRTVADFLAETAVYAGAGLLLGFGLGVIIVSRLPFGTRSSYIIGATTLGGLLFGVLGGEAGVNWVGGMIRERER